MSQRYYSSSSSSDRPSGRPTSQSSSSSSFRDIQRFGAGVSKAFTTPITDSFSTSQSSADIPLPDSRPESTHSSIFKFGAGDSMQDAEKGNTSPVQRPEVSKKRPFSFMITGAPRWTWVHALVLAISLTAVGCSIAAIVLSVQHHGSTQEVENAAMSGSGSPQPLSSMLSGSTVASTARVSSGENRSSNKPRSASSSTSSPFLPQPSPSPSTQAVTAETATVTTSSPVSPDPEASGATDTSPAAASSPTTSAPVSSAETQLSSPRPWTSFTVPAPTATWDVSWSPGATDLPPKVTVGQAFRGESIWPSSERVTRAAYVDSRPFGTYANGPASTDGVEGGRVGVPGVAAGEGGNSWPVHGLVHEFGGGGDEDDMPRFAKHQDAAAGTEESTTTKLSTLATRQSVTTMRCFANSTMTMTYGRTA